jgi:hypothetical protein
MADEVITDLEQATTAWLTAVLSRGDALTFGAVESFEVDTGGGNWSTNARLALRYTNGARGKLPTRLFLKMVDTDLKGESFGASEVTYYTRDYLGVEGVPLIRCYHGAYSEQKQRYHLLLDDLSETHVQAATKAPTLEYGLALAEGLAAMHAHWWGARRLAEAGAPIHTDEHIRRFVDIAEPGAAHITGAFSSQLEPHWPELIRSLYARHPAAIIARARDPEGFTLIHGDAGCTNILVPRSGDRPIYIIDRQPFDWSLTTWLGVYDLFYALVLDWDVELRRRFELPVLRRYHDRLGELGVSSYSWDRLWADYRLTAAMGVYIATEYCRGGENEELAWVWLPMLQRSLTACDDLDCQEPW